MLPSFTVPKPPRSPRNELRVAHTPVPVSNSRDWSNCEIAAIGRPGFSSPTKPGNEIATSTDARLLSLVTAPALVTCGARLEVTPPASVAPEDLYQATSGYTLP